MTYSLPLLLSLVGVPLIAHVVAAQTGGSDDSASSHQSLRTITVVGEGISTAVPDMAAINAGVETKAATAKEALNANTLSVEKMMGLLKTMGVADKDIQTSGFNIYPDYRHDPNQGQQLEVIGYRVQNQLQIRVRQLESLGKILDELVQVGSNRIDGISFSLADPSDATDAARRNAVADAKHRAELYATAAGVQLGAVISISEQQGRMPGPMPVARSFAMAEAQSVPIAAGEQELRASVTIVYQLQ